MANGTTDLTAPLSGMWRNVYRKAGQAAEARTQELLKHHVYTYPHGAGGGGGAAVSVCLASDSGAGLIALPSGSLTPIPFDTDDHDPDGYHDPVATPRRFTVPAGKAGWHRFSAALRTEQTSSASPPANYFMGLRLNGGSQYIGQQTGVLGAAYGLDLTYGWTPYYLLADGDYVEFTYTHNTGTTGYVSNAFTFLARFQVERLLEGGGGGGGGGGGNWVLVETQTLADDTTDRVHFTTIPADGAGLVLVVSAHQKNAAGAGSLLLRLNDDATTNYTSAWHEAYGVPDTETKSHQTLGGSASYVPLGRLSVADGLQDPADASAAIIAFLPGHGVAGRRKQVLALASAFTGVTQHYAGQYGGEWRGTAAITKLSLIPSGGSATFGAGSVFTLYQLTQVAAGGGGGEGADVTITTDASLTATESPANTFALAVALSPDAGNALSLHANGLYGTDTGTGGGTTEVTITGTEGVTVVESPANTFALGLTASADSGNVAQVRANGIYVPPAVERYVAAYYYVASTTMADPGAGNLRTNTTGSPGTVTQAAIDDLDDTGRDMSAVIRAMQPGDQVYSQVRDDSTRWSRVTLTAAPVDQPGWWLLAIEDAGSEGVIAGGQEVVVTFILGGSGGGTGGGGAVDSVNGQTGVVVLDAADVGAATPSEVTAAVGAHAALPDAHHAQGHNHTAADGSGALSNEEHDGYSQYANLGTDAATPPTNQLRLYAKDNGAGVATLYYITESGQIYELPTLTSGGGSGGSGAPANASYVTLAAEAKLHQETALGAGVIMTGTLAARPAFGTAGRLYLATDTDLVYRDSGSAWTTFATRASADVTVTTDASLTSTESPANTFALAARVSADAGNALSLHADGLYSTDTTGGGTTEVTITGDDGVTVTEAPANTFALATQVSADADNALELRGDGLYATGGAGGGGDFVAATGDTMSGTLAFQGAAVDAGGAIEVTSPDAPVTDKVLYGAGSPAFAPTITVATNRAAGIRFTPNVPLYLVAVRWYRPAAGHTPPGTVYLWDSTSTGTALLTVTALSGFADTAVGWKEQRLPAGTQPLLVAGRMYALSYVPATVTLVGDDTYTPVPDAELTFNAHVSSSAAGSGSLYPPNTGTTALSIEGAFRTTLSAPTPAASGVIRLPNSQAVAWRNATDGADLALTVSATDALTFNGAALLTQTTADALFLTPAEGNAAFLPLAGGTLTGDLVLSEATPTVSLKLTADTQPRSRLTDTALGFGPGGTTAPDATLSRTGAQQLAVNSTLTVTPAAGQAALVWGGTGSLSSPSGAPRISASANLELAASSYFFPTTDGGIYLGANGNRWQTVYAVTGTIQTSSRAVKEGVTPLDPSRAMQAVRNTPAVTFDYVAPERGPAWYDLPDDPEQAEQVLQQRLTAAPLEAAARHQHGFVAEDCDPLFLVGEGQTSPGSSIGILLACVQHIDQRLQALEGS